MRSRRGHYNQLTVAQQTQQDKFLQGQADASKRAEKIKILLLDVDGVLTDGKIFMGPSGETAKAFFAQDGLGITLARRAGIVVGIITGRTSQIVASRAAELKIDEVYQGVVDKASAMLALLAKYKLEADQAAYVGDDLNDLPALLQAGLACTVADAVPEIRKIAHFVAPRSGGNGGVRDIIEFILKSQCRWEQLVAVYQLHSGDECCQ